MARSAYRLYDSNRATMVLERTHSRRPIIHPNIAKAMECGFRFVGLRLDATLHDVVMRALRNAEWSNRHFSRPSENFGVDEGICGQIEVFDAARHTRHIALRNIALSLYFYRSDKGFGYALGIDTAQVQCDNQGVGGRRVGWAKIWM